MNLAKLHGVGVDRLEAWRRYFVERRALEAEAAADEPELEAVVGMGPAIRRRIAELEREARMAALLRGRAVLAGSVVTCRPLPSPAAPLLVHSSDSPWYSTAAA